MNTLNEERSAILSAEFCGSCLYYFPEPSINWWIIIRNDCLIISIALCSEFEVQWETERKSCALLISHSSLEIEAWDKSEGECIANLVLESEIEISVMVHLELARWFFIEFVSISKSCSQSLLLPIKDKLWGNYWVSIGLVMEEKKHISNF